MKTRPTRHHIRSKKRQYRLVGKRIILHPASVLLLLFVGVLLIVASSEAYSASMNIHATVPAPPIDTPAVITSPYNQQHVSQASIIVSGTCPPRSYVKLLRDDQLQGIADCTGSSFAVQISLHAEVNVLAVKVFNMTDNEGPAATPVVVYYDTAAPPQETSASTSTTINLAALDSASYHAGAVQLVSTRPTLSGWAPPYSKLTLTFHSDITTCLTDADGRGWWTCTLADNLPPGLHTVTISATTPDGKTMALAPFSLFITDMLSSLLKPLPASSMTIAYDYHYQTYNQGEPVTWDIRMSGGSPPYRLSIDWKDNTTSSFGPQSETTFHLQHTFYNAGSYQPLLKAEDADGTVVTMQLLAILKAKGSLSIASSLVRDTKNYLWIIWPAYIIILLMLVSFWLGEYQIIQRLGFVPKQKRRPRSH